jgi:AraC-like DNA-binding protein
MTEEQYPKIYLYRRVVQAKLFIDGHFADTINLEDTAGEAAFSKFHFIRLFKTIYGKTPHQYLISVRIENARLLLQRGLRVTEVCYAVGFDSTSSFSLLFKKLTGQSPQAYQRLELERKAAMQQKPLSFIPNCFAEKKGWLQHSNSQ